MDKPSPLNLKNILLYTFASLWCIWVIIHYLGYHPKHLALLSNHPYAGYLLLFGGLLTGLSGATYYRLKKDKKKKWVIKLRSWWLILISLFFSVTILTAFRNNIGINITPLPTAIGFFLFHSVGYLLALLVLALSMICLGQLLTARLPLEKPSSLLAMVVGISLMSFISVLLGLVNILYWWTLWPLLLGVLVWQRKELLVILRSWFLLPHNWRIRHWWQPATVLLGLFFIGFYWLASFKAFPVGFDGGALYANLAHQISGQHALPAAYQAFGWSVVMSWGEILFGSLTVSILLSQLIYLPAAALLYQIFRKWLQAPYALLAIVFTFTLPLWSMHTITDEKVDLGFLFISLGAIYLILDIFSWNRNTAKETSIWKNPFFRALLLVGWLIGFAFSVKYTALLLVVATVSMYLYYLGGGRLMTGGFYAFLGLIFLAGFHSWGNIPLENDRQGITIGLILIGIGVAATIWATFKNRTWWKKDLLGLLALGLGFVLAFAPWGVKHLAENNFRISVTNVLFGDPPQLGIQIPPRMLSYERRNNISPYDFQFLRTSQQSGGVVPTTSNTSAPQNNNQRSFDASREEVQRYIGYEDGIFRYTSIPFDLTFDQTVRQVRHKDIGFWALLFLPLLLLAKEINKRSWIRNAGVATVLIFYLASSFWSLTEASNTLTQLEEMSAVNQTFTSAFSTTESSWLQSLMMTIQTPFQQLAGAGAGFFQLLSNWSPVVYIPLLLLLISGLAYALRARWQQWAAPQQYVALFSFVFLLTWLFLGNAIVWYALPAFALISGLFLHYYQNSKTLFGEAQQRFVRNSLGGVIVLQLALNTVILMSASTPNQPANILFNWPMIEYASQADLGAKEVLNYFNPAYANIARTINKDPSAKVIRINTSLAFQLEDNNLRVLEDNQLIRFAGVTQRLKSPSEYVDVLKANGYKYVLYDLNSPSIDETPEKTLQKKCQQFLNIMVRHPEVDVLITDNFVADESLTQPIRLPNGQQAKAKQGLVGQTVSRGSVVLFAIK